jgi:hypothetical protein
MQTSSSPEVGASAANAGHPRNNERDNRSIPDLSIVGNRRLILSGCDEPPIYEGFNVEISSYFELITDSETLRFDSLWDAICARGRLAERNTK